MKRHKSLIPLSQDHHHGLMLAQLLKIDAPIYKGLPADIKGKTNYAIKSWEQELKPHFANEENILFPFVKGKNQEIDILIREIIVEHNELEKLFVRLDEIRPDESLLNTIGELLEKHIRKEERVLFAKIQSEFESSQLNELNNRIIAVNRSTKSC